MNPAALEQAVSFALLIALKASIVLALAAILQAVAHRWTSAAMRHLVWTLAIGAVLLLPIVSLTAPGWVVVTRTAPARGTETVALADAVPAIEERAPARVAHPAAAEPVSVWPLGISRVRAALAGVYVAGVLMMLIHFGMSRWSVSRLVREGTDVRDEEWTRLLRECAARLHVRRRVRLLRSRDRSMPMAFGTRPPTIVIPAIADIWEEDRRRAVVLHELAHVARFDCLTQALACAACTMYWFHPAAWWAARRLRIERELACDDLVIAAGSRAREYADHLLEIAYAFGCDRAPALAVSMARPRQLEGRMLAVLDAARNRRVPAWRVRVAGAAIATALLLPVATATPAIVSADPDAEENANARTAAPVLDAPVNAEARPPQSSTSWSARVLASAERVVSGAAARAVVTAATQVTAAAAQDGGGTWEIRPSGTDGVVHLRLAEPNSSTGSNVRVEQLDGLTAAQLTGAGGPVRFRLRRDAGTLTFEGVLRQGVGAGTFTFSPDPAFPAELVKRGFTRPTPAEQYQLARHDVGYAFLDELNAQGYAKPQTSELVRAGQHGVQAAFVHDLGALGYRLGSLAPLIELRDHGVTPSYIRELGEQGYKALPVDELRQARDHGVSIDFVKGMRDAGYASLTMPQLINARDHGVSPDFANELAAAGHPTLPLEGLIRARDHGVSAEYARDMRQLGHTVGIDDLIAARDHGVSAEFAGEIAALGYSGLPLESLIRLRDHGVTPKYAQELKALGYDRLAIDDLVMLRDHGVTTDRVRAANARAGTRLPVDMLKSLAVGGTR